MARFHQPPVVPPGPDDAPQAVALPRQSPTRRPTVVFGFVGANLDRDVGHDRWHKWRPSVSICQQEDLLVDRFELLVQRGFDQLAAHVADDIRLVSPETTVCISYFDLGDAWDFEEVFGALHDFARRYPFNPDEEDYLVHITTGTHVIQICLFLLTESRHLPGRLLQSAPPPRVGQGLGQVALIDLDLSRYDGIAARFASERQEGVAVLKQGIETRNARFNALMDQIEHVAVHSRSPILLTGPTGAGKSHLARRVFQLKKSRAQVSGSGRFVEVNCATLRGDTAMSTLFGHVKGAFTGALSDRPGLLRQAHDGVLFLDEVGELGIDEQAMLLRALEDKRFMPMGADIEVESNFQLICGTNRPLGDAVRLGKFRLDLLARINLWTFDLPGLRDRPEDIEPNLHYELDLFATQNGRRISFNKEARERFLSFATDAAARWTGNFRDLNAAVNRMATLAASGRITRDVVDLETARLGRDWAGGAGGAGGGRAGAGEDGANTDAVERYLVPLLGRAGVEALDRFDRIQLADVVAVCGAAASLSDAGRELFAASRARRSTTNDADRLRKYLARFDLDWQRIRDGLPATGDGG